MSARLQRFLALAAFFGAMTANAHASVSPSADKLGPITNSILFSFLITAVLVLAVRLAVGTPKLVPTRAQGVLETLIEGLRDILEPIVGKKAFPTAFPLLLTFFVFITVHNWSGLIPGVGTIGFGHEVDGHFHITNSFFRPHTSDLNGTIALAAVSFGAWFILCLKFAGPKLILLDLFGNKADKKELSPGVYMALSVIFIVVGFIEVFSIFIRPLTLSVRLFGNVFGGENVLHATSFLPPFYFMELLVGVVQAFVFTLLTSVYIGLICNHGDDHHDEEHAH